MKYITIPKEAVLDESAKTDDICLVDRYTMDVNNLCDLNFYELAAIIKNDDPENRYEFYKAVEE